MLGSVNTKQHCQRCGKKFVNDNLDDEGIYCPDCAGSRPTRYYIDSKVFGLGHMYSNPHIKNKKEAVFRTYTSALKVLVSLNDAYDRAIQENERFRVEDWAPAQIKERYVQNLFEAWLVNYETEREHLAKSQTRLDNLKKAQRFIVHFFKGKDINSINDKAIENFYHWLLSLDQVKDKDSLPDPERKRKERPERPYSTRYIKDILDTLKGLFLHYRAGNVPKFPSFAVVPAKMKQRLGLDRELLVVDKIPTRRGYRLACLTLIRTGMRLNEVSALRVVDLIDGTLYVDKAYSEEKAEIFWENVEKNGGVIPMMDREEFAMQFLRLSRKNGGVVPYSVTQELWEMLMEHVQGKKPDDFVFSMEDGTPIKPSRLYKVWVKGCKDAGVKLISLQQASRHSTATKIMQEHKQRALEEIRQQLGHNNTTTAQKHYIIDDERLN